MARIEYEREESISIYVLINKAFINILPCNINKDEAKIKEMRYKQTEEEFQAYETVFLFLNILYYLIFL